MLYQAQMRNFIRLVLIALLGSSLASCSTWVSDDFADPQVQLLRVEVVKAKLLEQSFILHMRIENPNDFSLPVRGLEWQWRADGALQLSFALQPGAYATVVMRELGEIANAA